MGEIFTLQLPGTCAWEAVQLAPADVRVTDVPRSGRTVSGYGARIPTRYMVRHGGRWRRVRVAQHGNAGSAYVMVNGARAYVESYGEA